MSKLWSQSDKLNSKTEAYTVGEDYLHDGKLLPYDIEASLAHGKMLLKIGILTANEYKKLTKALREIKKLHARGKFQIKPEQEDCHTAIEQYITENYGDVGKKIHTARGRNDQVMVMLRLYMKDNLKNISKDLQKVAGEFKSAASKYSQVPMPGYTHMQKAMPTTVGEWLGAYGDAFRDLTGLVDAAQDITDQNPLGSAAGFGIKGIDIDREVTTKELGFSKTQENSLYAGISRGFFELMMTQQMTLISSLAGKFASDMMLFTTQEFDYVSLPDEYTTGSSIMPNKHNYDLFEIMRGNDALVAGHQNQIQMVLSGLGSGFHRDLQLTKGCLISSFEITSKTLGMLIEILPKLVVHKSKLKKAMTDDLYATEQVYELVSSGVPFRDAYRKVKQNLKHKD